jgi:citrate synthase
MHTMVHENIKKFMEGFTYDAHPMGVFISTVGAMSTFYPDGKLIFDAASRPEADSSAHCENTDDCRLRIPPQHRTTLRLSRQRSQLHRQLPEHAVQDDGAEVPAQSGAGARARRPVHPARRPRTELLDQRDARHWQLARRSVLGTAGAAAALYGPLHGGANEAVLRMLKEIGSVDHVPAFIKKVKAGEGRLMGFGHRVYKSTTRAPRSSRRRPYEVFDVTGKNPLLEIALELERIALEDDYFVTRKLYPNVDFYSGLIYQAMGSRRDVPGALRHRAHGRLGRAVGRDAARCRSEDRAAEADLHWSEDARLRADGRRK